jgi:hypothetical protein
MRLSSRPSRCVLRAVLCLFSALVVTGLAAPAAASKEAQALDPNPPDHVVKLIFIHHSCGENWLRDDHGGLGLALAENNYFVSDTNYGWGPDAIGDRTDIPNWLEWFRSENTGTYMQALMEESGQNSEYTRPLADPGGENEIILFKSCFPNSDLSGSPDDPAAPGTDLTVANARYVYNEILRYFATRPDRLFVVISAPPLIHSENARNARAFNNWLVNDWLDENNYPLANVAVFDFYNVLTGPENHHRFEGGGIEHVYREGRDTAYYPSSPGDDHPSPEGNRRATEEFLPLLNIYYNRWQSGAPLAAPVASTLAPAGEQPEAPASGAGLPAAGLIDNFESGAPANTDGWTSYLGETAGTSIDCAPAGDSARNGSSALRIGFSVPSGSWATCILSFWEPQDWSASLGVRIPLHADRAGIPYNVLVYAGAPESQESYISYQDTPTDSVDGWAMVEIPWESFRRVDWEAEAGTPLAQADRVLGIGFGFDGLDAGTNAATVWVDDLGLIGSGAAAEPAQAPVSEGTGEGRRGFLPCPGAAALAVLLPAILFVRRKRG